MRRRLVLLLMALGVVLVASAPPVAAGPGGAEPWLRPMGQPYSDDGSSTSANWSLGGLLNPLIAGLVDGECGQIIDGVFFMAAPIDLGLEFEREVPTGTAIEVSPHAGWFVTQGVDGDTDEELKQAVLELGFNTSVNELSIDGVDVALQTIDTGFFERDLRAEQLLRHGPGDRTGPIRSAVRGNVAFGIR